MIYNCIDFVTAHSYFFWNTLCVLHALLLLLLLLLLFLLLLLLLLLLFVVVDVVSHRAKKTFDPGVFLFTVEPVCTGDRRGTRSEEECVQSSSHAAGSSPGPPPATHA